MSVRELLVRGEGAIVPRNVREPSEELCTPLSGDVRSPQRLALTRKVHQQRHVLKSHRHLADGEVECVGLRPPVVQKRAKEGEVVPEAFMRCFRGITSHWLSPGLTALQAGVLQRIA
jgi:hypothetical protein